MLYQEEGIDFGLGQYQAHFAHANGFHPMVYEQFLHLLNFQNINAICLSPFRPGSDYSALKDWRQFAEEIITHLDRKGLKKIVGLGHSLGAVSTLIAACLRPDLFSKLILIDPVIIDDRNLRKKNWLPMWLRRRVVPIAKIAGKRRTEFDSKKHAYEQLRQKKAYCNMKDDIFKRFIDYGFEERGGKVVLSYSKDWEQQVYITVPRTVSYFDRITVPTHVYMGERSEMLVFNDFDQLVSDYHNIHFHLVKDAGHLIPMERPDELAININSLL